MFPVKTRPTPADLGLNRLAMRLLLVQAVLAVLFLAALPRVGLTVAWSTVAPFLVGDLALAGFWLYFLRVPGRPREWIVPETLAAQLLLLTLSHVLSPAQYVAVAFRRPLIDHALASADSALGINVARLAAWTLAHPRVNVPLVAAYSTFLPQLVVLAAILGIALRDREALWEYVFHFHVCATLTVAVLAMFPAACAFQYLGFASTLDQTRFIAQFNGLRDGTFTVIRFNDMEGLISLPSFHAAGALMVVWALRRHPKAMAPAVVLNVALIAATVFTGAHYVVDVLATFVMFAGSVVLWRRYGQSLLVQHRV